jgi:hypothetical protein
MSQVAPYPRALAELITSLHYRPHWKFGLTDSDRGQGSKGLTFEVWTVGYDTYHPDRGEGYSVVHYFPVPPAAYDVRSWRRWLFERLLEVERHEAAEFFRVGDDQPYAPVHAPGSDPYTITELVTDQERRTSFRGEVKED